MKEKRSTFSGHLGFILAASGSAVGLGNIWRFPYLAAKNGGGLFILVYIILALTFGFAILTTEIAIGRNTKQGPLTAYKKINPKWGFLGLIATVVPALILPYYSAIGGWIIKYIAVFVTGHGAAAAEDGYFGGFITSDVEPIVWMLIFIAMTVIVVFAGVEKGIERYSRIIMPALLMLIIGISIFSLTLRDKTAGGGIVTGLDGLKVYLIPNIEGMGIKDFINVIFDAMGQLFYSISVAMGIMIAYGSYVKEDVNLVQSVNHIEFFDTLVALLAGLMIIPAVIVFFGEEGMSAGPGLMFVTLPKVFLEMGKIGALIGFLFFIMVLFAAVTSSVSIMEAIVASIMDEFKINRFKASVISTIWTVVLGVIVCLGYTDLYFEYNLPNGAVAQVLDIMDYVSNSLLMPILALCTFILIGWVVGEKVIVDEVTNNGKLEFKRKGLYTVMVRFVAPVMLAVLLVKAFGLF